MKNIDNLFPPKEEEVMVNFKLSRTLKKEIDKEVEAKDITQKKFFETLVKLYFSQQKEKK